MTSVGLLSMIWVSQEVERRTQEKTCAFYVQIRLTHHYATCTPGKFLQTYLDHRSKLNYLKCNPMLTDMELLYVSVNSVQHTFELIQYTIIVLNTKKTEIPNLNELFVEMTAEFGLQRGILPNGWFLLE